MSCAVIPQQCSRKVAAYQSQPYRIDMELSPKRRRTGQLADNTEIASLRNEQQAMDPTIHRSAPVLKPGERLYTGATGAYVRKYAVDTGPDARDRKLFSGRTICISLRMDGTIYMPDGVFLKNAFADDLPHGRDSYVTKRYTAWKDGLKGIRSAGAASPVRWNISSDSSMSHINFWT